MSLKHATTIFNIDEAGLYPLASDNSGALATYGALLRLPGIQSIGYTPELMSKELAGDGTILDITSRVRKITGTATFAKNDLDVKAALLGGAVVDSAAVSPNQVASYVHKHGDRPAWFKLAWRVLAQSFLPASATADTLSEIFKCRVTRVSGGGGSFEEYTPFSFDFEAIRLEGNATVNGAAVVSPVFAEQFRETGATLA